MSIRNTFERVHWILYTSVAIWLCVFILYVNITDTASGWHVVVEKQAIDLWMVYEKWCMVSLSKCIYWVNFCCWLCDTHSSKRHRHMAIQPNLSQTCGQGTSLNYMFETCVGLLQVNGSGKYSWENKICACLEEVHALYRACSAQVYLYIGHFSVRPDIGHIEVV